MEKQLIENLVSEILNELAWTESKDIPDPEDTDCNPKLRNKLTKIIQRHIKTKLDLRWIQDVLGTYIKYDQDKHIIVVGKRVFVEMSENTYDLWGIEKILQKRRSLIQHFDRISHLRQEVV
jgi:hypothetical protein